MTKTLKSKEVFALEAKLVGQGVSIENLMSKAGYSVFEEIKNHFDRCAVIVLAGPGNNGGDGFVVANLLKRYGWKVDIAFDNAATQKMSDAARKNRLEWLDQVLDFDKVGFTKYDLIVDALFGIGLHTKLRSPYLELVSRAVESGVKTIAIDIPSGIDSDTGEVLGAAINAAYTITFNYKKPAHVKSLKHVGEVIVKDIGL